jgi:hypothetical protein
MSLHVSALQGHLQAKLFKDSNSLYANHVVFLSYAVDVPSYLFELFELQLFLCHTKCAVFRCGYQGIHQ